ncbi:MAG TPA: NERD domain-containing protein [Streptosporangiaceae bacterium]|nr:NERD domain-containing protein [Streptosporangiaceae bacterium]
MPGPRDGARAPADSAPEHPTSSPPASGSSDADDDSPEPTRPAGEPAAPGSPGAAGGHDSAGHDSALRAARLSAAFRSASRNVWPGTEDRQGRSAPSQPDAPAAESGPEPDPEQGTYTFGGPLGAGPETNRQIWEPRRLHQVPRLRRAPRPTPSPEGTSPPRQSPPGQPQPGQPQPGQGARDTGPRAASPEAPRNGSSGSRPTSSPSRPPHQDIPVRRLALPSGSSPESGPRKRRDSRESNRAKRHRPTSGPAYAAASNYDGTARKAERHKVGDLMADNRMRIWRRRLLIAIAAGLVFSFIFTWRAGLTAAVLAAIADVIYRSRTTASMPPGGVRLTGAQKRTQRQLGHMERSGYRALHSRPIPGSREQIDHFVVGPTGAYAIDSEDWDKNLPIRTRNARQLWHGPFSKKDRLEHARWEAGQASERLSAELGHPVYVRPVLAVYGPKVPWNVATIREVDVFNGDRLRKYLRRNALLKERPRLTKDEVEQIYAAAARVLPLNNADLHAPVG